MQPLKRKVLIALVCTGMLATGVRIYYQWVPRGVAYTPFTSYSHQLPMLTSPNGKTYQVFVNDAGAMHSGNYWAWVIDSHWLTGRYVVTEGYLTSDYAKGELELIVEWDSDLPVIAFEDDRYSQ
ncbi:MAG: hypothetical protein ACPGVO_08190 [Spirulinaceae cyanobacterium]